MKINTRKFGEVEVAEDKIINMPLNGLLGFPEVKRYVLLEREETRPFCWYQSVDEPELAFVVINPFVFKSDYAVDLKQAVRDMGWEDVDNKNLALYVVVNFSDEDPPNITANLIGPIVINTVKLEAVQMVISDSSYSHQHKVID